jgi:acyl-CoA synthetase (AMP-forming)/AMP-acid ligase II
MFAAPGSPAETLSWREFQGKVAQTANLFRTLGVGESDAVAFLLPNCTEAVLTFVGGQVAGIVNPINPLLEAEQIAGILRETGAKVLVTLRAFPKTDLAQKAAKAVSLAPNVKTVVEVDLLRYLTGIKKLIVPLVRPKNPSATGPASSTSPGDRAQPSQLRFEDGGRTGSRLLPHRGHHGPSAARAASLPGTRLQRLGGEPAACSPKPTP